MEITNFIHFHTLKIKWTPLSSKLEPQIWVLEWFSFQKTQGFWHPSTESRIEPQCTHDGVLNRIPASHNHHNVLDFSVLKAVSGPPFPENISSTFFLKQRRDGCKNRLQPFDTLPPPKTASPSHLLKSPYRITVWQDYRIEGKIVLPMASLKTSWAISRSPFSVLRKFSIKWLSLATSQHLGV